MKRILPELAQLGALAGVLLGALHVLKAPSVPKDPRYPLFKEVFATAPARTFAPPAADALEPFAFKSSKDDAGPLYRQALEIHARYPQLEGLLSQAAAGDEAAAAKLAKAKSVTTLEKVGAYRTAALAEPPTSLLDPALNGRAEAEVLGAYAKVLEAKGRAYGAKGRKDFEKLYYQTVLKLGLHLAGDWSPFRRMQGLRTAAHAGAGLAESLRGEGNGVRAAELEQALAPLRADASKELADILLMAAFPDGMQVLGAKWLSQPSFQRPYAMWAAMGVVTQWSEDEFKSGPLPGRKAFLEIMAGLGEPHLAALGAAGLRDLAAVTQSWKETPEPEREAFKRELQGLPELMVDPFLQEPPPGS